MGIDIDTSKKWMDIRRRANDMSQSTMDEAAQTGDYSKVDRMSSIMDRISALGDHHVQQIAQAHEQDKAAGGEVPSPEFTSPQSDVAWPDEPPPANLAQATPPAPPATTPGLLPNMGSEVHEAARGATKGAIEAIKGESALPRAPGIAGYAPGELRLEAAPELHYAPGELKMTSDLPPWKVPPPAPKEESSLPDFGTLYGNQVGDWASALPSAEDQEVEAYLRSSPALREAEMKRRLGNLFPPDGQAPAADLTEEQLQDRLRKYARAQPRTGLPTPTESTLPVDIMALPASEEPQEPPAEAAPSALPTFDQPPGAPPGTDQTNPSEDDEINDLARFSKNVEQEYGGNGQRLLQDFGKTAPLNDREREFVRRVQVELGPRPKLATIPKILAALAVGVGSVLGAWITGKYNGQALMDMDADQKEWDRRRSEIGREVYTAHKLWGRTALQGENSMERTMVQQSGQDSRLATREGGQAARLDVTEKGKNARAEKKEAGLDRRHAEYLAYRIKQIESKKNSIKMTPDDQKEFEKLQMIYRNLGMQRQAEQMTSAQFTKQSAAVMDQIDAIINKYRQMQP